jgi:hypothetical protein
MLPIAPLRADGGEREIGERLGPDDAAVALHRFSMA